MTFKTGSKSYLLSLGVVSGLIFDARRNSEKL